MGYGDYRLAALDMDGTLLNSSHVITPQTRQILRQASEAGKLIALCTGRCLSELWEHLDALEGVAYAICENGGCLYDVRAGRVLEQLFLPEADVKRILALASGHDVCVQCFIEGQSYMQLTRLEALERYGIQDFASVFQKGSRFVADIRSACKGKGVEKINLYFHNDGEKRAFRGELGDVDLHLADSLGTGYEISPQEATKGRGLKVLCGLLGLELSETIAVGDGGNDLELMEAAGFSVAMANATAEVKSAADALTEDCDHDGAARAVARHMLIREAEE